MYTAQLPDLLQSGQLDGPPVSAENGQLVVVGGRVGQISTAAVHQESVQRFPGTAVHRTRVARTVY